MGVIRWCMSVAYYMMFYFIAVSAFSIIFTDILGIPLGAWGGWDSIIVIGLAIISVYIIQPHLNRAYQHLSGKLTEKS